MMEFLINSRIDALSASSAIADDSSFFFNTPVQLLACARSAQWAGGEFDALEFVSKKAEISKVLYVGYLESGTRATLEPLSTEMLTLAGLLLLKDFVRLVGLSDNPRALKRLNGALKLLDSLKSRQASPDAEFLSSLDSTIDQFFDDLNRPPLPLQVTHGQDPLCLPIAKGTIPVVVLFWEGPIARAYLATIRSMGLKVQKIVQLVSRKDLASRKPVGSFLPGMLKLAYAESKQRNSIHYWSVKLRKDRPGLYQSIRSRLESELSFSPEIVDDALALNDLARYAESLERIMVDDLSDPALLEYLKVLGQSRVLFTGGGIVPKDILGISHLELIHVHPGYLPDIRGADCVLWSEILKGTTSASSFYMAPGIDDGDVIQAHCLPPVRFDTSILGIDTKTLYRATYAFFDPWVRAYVLRSTLNATDGLRNVNKHPQREQGGTFHFMHERIRRFALARLFS